MYQHQFFVVSRLEKLQPVLLTHGDSVQKVGERFRVGAQSSNHLIAAIYNEQMRLYGVQFHPEVIVHKICSKLVKKNWRYEVLDH